MWKACKVGMPGLDRFVLVEVWGFDQFRFPNDIAAVFVPHPEADRQWHPRLHLLFASWCTTCQFTGHGTGGCSTEGTRCLEEDERAGELRWKHMKTEAGLWEWLFIPTLDCNGITWLPQTSTDYQTIVDKCIACSTATTYMWLVMSVYSIFYECDI